MQLTAEQRQNLCPSFSKPSPILDEPRVDAIPLLDSIEIAGKTITADAVLTQREFARYLVEQRGAHDCPSPSKRKKHLLGDIAFHFDSCDRKPDFTTTDPADHGRVETRNIRVATDLNDYLDSPHVGQPFMVERITLHKKSGKRSHELAHGITGKTKDQAIPARILNDNRGHWSIENSCH